MIFYSIFFFVTAIFIAAAYAVRKYSSNFSLSFLLFWAMLLVHGLSLLGYLFVSGPGATGEHGYIYNKIQEQSNSAQIRVRLINAMALMFVGITLGAELMVRLGPKLILRYRNSWGNNSIYIDGKRKLFLWAVVMGMLIVSIISSHFSHVEDYYRFSGSELGRAALRQSTGGTQYYFYNVLLSSVAPFFVMVSYCQDVTKEKKICLPSLLTFCLFCVVLLGKVATLSKAPPVIFIVQLALLLTLLKSSKIDFLGMCKIISLLVILFFCIISFTFPELSWFEVLKFLYYRVFDIPNEVLLEYFAAIPEKIPHSWGASVLAIIGGESMNAHRPVYYEVAAITRNSYLSTSNAMFVGDAWAQFSWWGVVGTSILVGFWIRFIDWVALKEGNSDLAACIFASGSFGILTILSTAFSTGLITGGLLLVPLVSLLFVNTKKSSHNSSRPTVISL